VPACQDLLTDPYFLFLFSANFPYSTILILPILPTSEQKPILVDGASRPRIVIAIVNDRSAKHVVAISLDLVAGSIGQVRGAALMILLVIKA